MKIVFGEQAEERLSAMSPAEAAQVKQKIIEVVTKLPEEMLPEEDEMLSLPVQINDKEEINALIEQVDSKISISFLYDIGIRVVVKDPNQHPDQ